MKMKKRLTPEEFVKMARATPPDERTPYAFEKRVMSQLAVVPEPDPLAFWTQCLWRAMIPCLGVMVAAAIVSFSRGPEAIATGDGEFELDRAVLAPAESAFDLDA
jgi:hypothetical protein